MVGIVVVSHSRRLAEAAVELALQMVQGTPPPIEIAAGLDGGVLGTDAVAVMEAIDAAASASAGGVFVLMDLGSAVLSAELALDLRGDEGRVVLSDAPIVEGLVAAVVLAAAGAGLDEVAAEARAAGGVKGALLDAAPSAEVGAGAADATSIELVLRNPHGLHARPAALFVETVRGFEAEVAVANVTTGGSAVSGRSVSALSTLGARDGHRIEVRASGRQAREALAAVSTLVGRNFHEREVPVPAATRAAAPGIGIGPKRSLPGVVTDRPVTGEIGDAEAERRRLADAVARTRVEVKTTRERVAATVGEQEAAIFDAHLLLLEDDELVGRAYDGSARGAVAAWAEAVHALAGRFSVLDDPYLRARASDITGIGDQVLAHLLGTGPAVAEALEGVLVAPDLTPAQAVALDPARVDGIVLASGSPLSHAAILARSLGIPAVVAAGEAILSVPDGTVLVVDGSTGEVVVDPDPDTLAKYRARIQEHRRRREELARTAAQPARTRDGTIVEVAANVGSADDAALAVQNGADSVGLLRSEFLFLDRREAPREEEQLAAYSKVAGALDGRRLTVRTLDAGADKPIPYLPQTRSGSALGCRGIRLSLEHPELFRAQLRALVRLGRQHPVTVLFPMLSTIEELAVARRLLVEEAGGELPEGLEVGAMVEVPAFALQTRAAAGLVDVFSIGTNDLTQYTLAADRGDASVAHLADPLHPSVLRLVGEVAAGAGDRARVAVCGEIAGDPSAAGLLIGLGVRELSMSPPAIPAVKAAVRAVSTTGAAELAWAALEQSSAVGVRGLLGSGR